MQIPGLTNKKHKSGLYLTLVLVFLIIFIMASTGSAQIKMGDINGDGVINVLDVTLLMKYVLGLQSLTADQQKLADVNGDGVINVNDIALVMQRSIGLVDRFPMPVVSVEDINIVVYYGITLTDIDFPGTVKAKLHDQSFRNIEVLWEENSTPLYNPLKEGSYIFIGNLVNLPGDVTNPEKVTAKAVVTVSFYWVPSEPAPVDPIPIYQLTVGAFSGQTGWGTVYGTGKHAQGTEVPISALPNTGYAFSNWTADPSVGSFGSEDLANTTYTMPGQDVTVSAVFIRGDISNATAADFVYDATETSWSFSIINIALLEGQQVTLDLTGAIHGNLEYSDDDLDYTVTVAGLTDPFSIDASNANTLGGETVILTANSTINTETLVTIDVTGMTAAGSAAENLEITFTRNDTGQSATASFNITAIAVVSDEAGLAAALANPAITTIILEGNITLTGDLTADYDQTINLNGYTLDLNGFTLTGSGNITIIGSTLTNGTIAGTGTLSLGSSVILDSTLVLNIETVILTTANHLETAIDGSVETIILGGNIDFGAALVIERAVTIDLNEKSLDVYHILVKDAEVVIENGELLPHIDINNWWDDGAAGTPKYFIRSQRTPFTVSQTELLIEGVKIDATGAGAAINRQMVLIGNAMAHDGTDKIIDATDKLTVKDCNLFIPKGSNYSAYTIYTFARENYIIGNDFNDSWRAFGVESALDIAPVITVADNIFAGMGANNQPQIWVVPFIASDEGKITINTVEVVKEAINEAKVIAITSALSGEPGNNTFGEGNQVTIRDYKTPGFDFFRTFGAADWEDVAQVVR